MTFSSNSSPSLKPFSLFQLYASSTSAVAATSNTTQPPSHSFIFFKTLLLPFYFSFLTLKHFFYFKKPPPPYECYLEDGEIWFFQSVMESPYPTPISPTRTRVGWIGIGVMGGAMASRLRAAGYALTIYSRTPSKSLELQTLGAQLAASPAAVARASDVVFTMVGHPSDVRSVVLGDDGILSGLSPGSVTVDCTSSHPDLARSIAAATAERGCWAVDAPVSGGDIGAREGKLAILAGGDVGVVRWLTPLFEAMGKATYMGPAGSGQSCKIANQIAVGGSILGLSEGLVFAEKAGLDLRRFVGAVGGGAAGSKVMELFGERMIERDFRPGGFAEYMVKDLGMGLEGGGGDDEKGKVVLPGAALCKQLYLGMVANGNGKMGTQGLITVIEKINGK